MLVKVDLLKLGEVCSLFPILVHIHYNSVYLLDFTEALKLEPDNKTTKEELRKIAERIETEKRRVLSAVTGLGIC